VHEVCIRGWTNVLDTHSHVIMPLNFFLWRCVKECLQKFHGWHCKVVIASASNHATVRGRFREVFNSKIYVIRCYVPWHVLIFMCSFLRYVLFALQLPLVAKKSSDMMILIYLLTVIGLSPGGSSTVHIYTQTVHRTAQWNRTKQLTTEQQNWHGTTQLTEQHN